MGDKPQPSSDQSSKPGDRSPRQVLDDFLSQPIDFECPVTGQDVNATRFELLISSAWMQAMNGKSAYFSNLFDRVMGREPVEVRHAGPSGEPLKLYDGVSPADWDDDLAETEPDLKEDSHPDDDSAAPPSD